MRKALGALEGHLKHRTFLVGHRITLADIIAASNVFTGFTKARLEGGGGLLCGQGGE